MYMSMCCTPGRIRRSPLPTLLCYFKRCCFNHTFDKKRYSKIILVVDFKSRWRRCFVWRCVVDDINRCTCRCVVHPVGSEDPLTDISNYIELKSPLCRRSHRSFCTFSFHLAWFTTSRRRFLCCTCTVS